MKKVKITKATYVAGEKVKVGQIVECEDRDAYYLVGIKKAVYADEKDAKAAAAAAKTGLNSKSGLK